MIAQVAMSATVLVCGGLLHEASGMGMDPGFGLEALSL